MALNEFANLPDNEKRSILELVGRQANKEQKEFMEHDNGMPKVVTDPTMEPGTWRAYKGVITSNPPEETKPWWEKYHIKTKNNWHVLEIKHLPAIVAEAERRGRVAMGEVMKKRIEWMRKTAKKINGAFPLRAEENRNGYNQALSDVIASLKAGE